MKKTVIIAIFIVYLASIVLVQIFGVPVTLPKGGSYIDGIEITGITLTNPIEGQDTEIRTSEKDGKIMYLFKFVAGEYTMDEESLKNNPNRVRIDFILQPDDANVDYLEYIYDDLSAIKDESAKTYCVIEETAEVVFLKKGRIEIEMQENRANMNVRDSIIIRAY